MLWAAYGPRRWRSAVLRSRRPVQFPTAPVARQRRGDPVIDLLLLAVDAVRVDPQQHRHVVPEPAGNLGRRQPAVQPQRRRRMAKVIRPAGQRGGDLSRRQRLLPSLRPRSPGPRLVERSARARCGTPGHPHHYRTGQRDGGATPPAPAVVAPTDPPSPRGASTPAAPWSRRHRSTACRPTAPTASKAAGPTRSPAGRSHR